MRAGLVPLLPKPTASFHMNSFTFVPVPQLTPPYASLRVVAADPAEAGKFGASLHSLQGGDCFRFKFLISIFVYALTKASQLSGYFAFSALAQLVGHREEHPACKIE